MRSLAFCLLVACAGSPSTVLVDLSPSVISSLDGTTAVTVLVSDGEQPLSDTSVSLSVAYADRNGIPHMIDPATGKTDTRGVFRTTITGLTFDGAGTITVTAETATADATFAVLDRTPPKLEILPPTTDKRVGPGLPLDVQIRVSDEIGVSEVIFDGIGGIDGGRATIAASGTIDTTFTFHSAVAAGAVAGPTIELHAIARDLSGNVGVAPAITLTVDPAITIATPPGLSGSLLVEGNTQQLVNPRAIVVSSKDGHLYVADQANTGACVPSCIWRVDAATGAIDATPVVVGQGRIEGLALDATSDNLFFTDRQNRIGRLTFNGTAYANAVACVDPAQQQPQDPFHLVNDAALGLLVADGGSKTLMRVASCATNSSGTTFSTNANFDQPRGVALGATGEIYVSDAGRDRISRVDRTNGTTTLFEGGITSPLGMRWYAGATMPWSNTLMVASSNDRIIASTKGAGRLAATYLRNAPADLAFDNGTMFVVTSPGFGNRGRIYKVTGF